MTPLVKTPSIAQALLAGRAFDEACKRAWTEVHRQGRREAALFGAAAYLWQDDLDNAQAFLAMDDGSVDPIGAKLVEELILMKQGGDASPRLVSALERALLAKSFMVDFAVLYLIKQSQIHNWTFATQIDWSLLARSERDASDLIESIFTFDAGIGSHILAQYLTSTQADVLAYLPPEHCVSNHPMGTWRQLLEEHGVPEASVFHAIVKHGCKLQALIYAPRDLKPDEISLALIFCKVCAAEYPALFSSFFASIARKSEYTLSGVEILKIYRIAFDLLQATDGAYMWLRRETLTRARKSVNLPPLSDDALDQYPPDQIRILILTCAAVNDAVSGVLLSEILRREQPDVPSAVLSAWMALYFNSPEWSVAGFQALGYVAPEHAGSLPMLPLWPHRPLPADVIAPWIRARATWPRISVVVPSYQQGQFIEQTLLSLLNQDYPNLEILVEDGGSTDSTTEVLAKYAHRLASVRSGPDGGQSAALNQGFQKATGEILSWLNSDDMLAPLALFHVAEAYLEGGELLVGACFEFKDGRFVQINLPSLSPGPLEQRPMADLKDKWFMGHYFYQPEVFFSAEVYKRAGNHIDAGLHYTMDYDLWMRMGGVGAMVSKVHWPIALFRRHEEQKTSNLDRTVIEQGEVRKKYVKNITDNRRLRATRRRLAAVFAKKRTRILVVTGKYGRFFPVGFERQVQAAFNSTQYDVDFVAAKLGLDVNGYDLVLMIVTLTMEELNFLRTARESSSVLVAGWFWDNHHMFRENLEFASLMDIGMVSHDFAKAYVESKNMMLLESRLISYTQWSRETFSTLQRYQQQFDRKNDLYGGFVAYSDAPDRISNIMTLQDSGFFPQLKLIDPDMLGGYYGMTEADKFVDWCKYKTSLCANVERDLPIRFFDALVTGQIPIIPANALDLPLLRARYPEEDFVVCKSLAPEDVRQAWLEALNLYDRAGLEGVVARTSRAVSMHSFEARLAEVFDVIRAAGED